MNQNLITRFAGIHRPEASSRYIWPASNEFDTFNGLVLDGVLSLGFGRRQTLSSFERSCLTVKLINDYRLGEQLSKIIGNFIRLNWLENQPNFLATKA